MEVLLHPLAGAAVAVDGVAEESQPVVVVLHEPLLGLDVVLQEIAEGGQFDIPGIDKPLEEVFASTDGLLQCQKHSRAV